MRGKKIVTSALPYIHGTPHLGNLVGSILPADMYHRFLDVVGVENIAVCGSDEHGTPLELAAKEEGIAPEKYADRQHSMVKKLVEDFNTDFSLFSRTHTEYNRKQTHRMFRKLYRNGYITEKSQEMAFCQDCERFLPDRYIEGECPHCGGLARGDQCDDCGKLLEPEEIIEPYCTVCEGKNIVFKDTKNLYLQLPKFEDRLRDWMESGEHLPENLRKEVMNLLEDGLEDRCITRDISWGFDVPTEGLEGLDDDTYEDKVLYVWFDAPIGYIGITRQYFDSLGKEKRWEEYWKGGKAETVYNMGKDNTIFHTIIWPAILMGQEEDYNLPDYEFIYQLLLSKDVQFSKSRGVGLDGRSALQILPEPDYWRYYLASVLPVGHDSKFSWDDFEARINNELNDTIGNYVNRVLSLADKWFGNRVPDIKFRELEEDAKEFLYGDEGVSEKIGEYLVAIEDDKNLRRGLKKAVSIARLGDEFLSDKEPWKNEEVKEDVIYACLQSLKPLAAALYPYTPEASGKIWEFVDAKGELDDGKDHLEEFAEGENLLRPGKQLNEREILFEKVDAEELSRKLDEMNDSEEEDDEGEKMEDMISFEDFQKMDLRTATVEKVEEHPNADKLYLVQVDVGGETKQSCAGLKEHFKPEELEGRKVIVVNNLEPAELRGEKSEVMVLAVDTEDGEVVLLRPEKDVRNGLKVR